MSSAPLFLFFLTWILSLLGNGSCWPSIEHVLPDSFLTLASSMGLDLSYHLFCIGNLLQQLSHCLGHRHSIPENWMCVLLFHFSSSFLLMYTMGTAGHVGGLLWDEAPDFNMSLVGILGMNQQIEDLCVCLSPYVFLCLSNKMKMRNYFLFIPYPVTIFKVVMAL